MSDEQAAATQAVAGHLYADASGAVVRVLGHAEDDQVPGRAVVVYERLPGGLRFCTPARFVMTFRPEAASPIHSGPAEAVIAAGPDAAGQPALSEGRRWPSR